MAERLTECIDSHLLDNGEMVKEYSLNSKIKLNHFSCMDIPNAVYDKLGELEDILEKYGIESVEELGCLIEQTPKFIVKENIEKYGQEINGVFFSNEQMLILSQYNELQEPYKKRYEQIKIDRDTWKKACELACEREDDCYVYDNIHRAHDFYQQAKKEGNDERN